MSRNKEKAQAALNRFHDQKAKEAGVLESNPNLRPKYVQSVDSLPQAEKWRSTIISDISTRLTWIQDPDASEAEIRELNDTINKLFNEKRAWEYHIKSLGGNDYLNFGKNLNSSGLLTNVDLTGATSRGYRYFGRAKELPDVKKLLEAKSAKPRVEKKEARKEIEDLEYYGVYDEKQSYPSVLSFDEQELINSVAAGLGEDLDGIEELQAPDVENEPVDKLLAFEKTRETELLREMKSEKKGEYQYQLEDFFRVVPGNDDVQKWLVERKRKELLEKLGMGKG